MSGISVAFDFEGASGTVVRIDGERNEIVIELVKEGSRYSHSFAFTISTESVGLIATVTVQNAGRSPYATGWRGYKCFAQEISGSWHRIDNSRYDGMRYSFGVLLTSKTIRVAWYPLYSREDLSAFVTNKKLTAFLHDSGFGVSYLDIGHPDQPTVCIVARQHSGESMASYCIEGFVESWSQSELSCKPIRYVLFPMLNAAGVAQSCHRLTPDGIDLNRSWRNDEVQVVAKVRETMHNIAMSTLIIDIHGDEISKTSYLVQRGRSAVWNPVTGSTPSQAVLVLKPSGFVRRFLRDLVYHRRLLRKPGLTLAEYAWSVLKVPAITFEISAHAMDATASRQLGAALFKWIENHLQKRR